MSTSAAGPWMRLEDAPWARDGRVHLFEWAGQPDVAFWDDDDEKWYLGHGFDTMEIDPDRVARINMEGEEE